MRYTEGTAERLCGLTFLSLIVLMAAVFGGCWEPALGINEPDRVKYIHARDDFDSTVIEATSDSAYLPRVLLDVCELENSADTLIILLSYIFKGAIEEDSLILTWGSFRDSVPSYQANVVVSESTAAYADTAHDVDADCIDSTNIADGSVTTDDIATNTISFDDIATDGVKSDEIISDGILERHLKVVNSATDEDLLTYESVDGDFEWHAPGALWRYLYDSTDALADTLLGDSISAHWAAWIDTVEHYREAVADSIAAHWAEFTSGGGDSSWKSIDIDTIGGYTDNWVVTLHKIFVGENVADSCLMTKKWISDQIGAGGGGDVTDVIGGDGLVDNGSTGDITVDVVAGFGIITDGDSVEIDTTAAVVFGAIFIGTAAQTDSAVVTVETLEDSIAAHWAVFTDTVEHYREAIGDSIADHWAAFMDTVSHYREAVHDSLAANWSTFIADDTVDSYREAIADTIAAHWAAFIDTVEHYREAIADSIAAHWALFIADDTVDTYREAIADSIAAHWSVWVDTVEHYREAVGDSLAAHWALFIDTVEHYREAVGDSIAAHWTAFIDTVEHYREAIHDSLVANWATFTDDSAAIAAKSYLLVDRATVGDTVSVKDNALRLHGNVASIIGPGTSLRILDSALTIDGDSTATVAYIWFVGADGKGESGLWWDGDSLCVTTDGGVNWYNVLDGGGVETDPTLTNDGAVTIGHNGTGDLTLTFDLDGGDGTITWDDAGDGGDDRFEFNKTVQTSGRLQVGTDVRCEVYSAYDGEGLFYIDDDGGARGDYARIGADVADSDVVTWGSMGAQGYALLTEVNDSMGPYFDSAEVVDTVEKMIEHGPEIYDKIDTTAAKIPTATVADSALSMADGGIDSADLNHAEVQEYMELRLATAFLNEEGDTVEGDLEVDGSLIVDSITPQGDVVTIGGDSAFVKTSGDSIILCVPSFLSIGNGYDSTVAVLLPEFENGIIFRGFDKDTAYVDSATMFVDADSAGGNFLEVKDSTNLTVGDRAHRRHYQIGIVAPEWADSIRNIKVTCRTGPASADSTYVRASLADRPFSWTLVDSAVGNSMLDKDSTNSNSITDIYLAGPWSVSIGDKHWLLLTWTFNDKHFCYGRVYAVEIVWHRSRLY